MQQIDREYLLVNFKDTLLLEMGLSSLSIEAYTSDINLFFDYLERNHLDLVKFTSEDIQEYLSFCSKKSSRSISRFLCSLRSYVKFLKAEQLREDDPMLSISNPKFTMKIPQVMSEQCVDNMLNAPDILTPVGMRDKAMLETLYATGLRVSELVNLTFETVNLTDGFLLIKGKGSKERMVPLGESAVYYLEYYLKNARVLKDNKSKCDYVFLSSKGLGPMTRIGFWYRVKVYAKQIGLIELPSPHTFRHAFATHLLNHDADLRTVQMLLGHSSLTVTQIYTHVATARMHSIYNKAHPRA